MKLKALIVTALFVAGVAASVAVAKGPPEGKGKRKDDAAASSTGSTTSGKHRGKDKKRASAACRPTVSLVFKGDFVAAGGAAPTGSTSTSTSTATTTTSTGTSAGPSVAGTFQMKVRQANRHGKSFVGEVVTISYDAKTKFRRRGHAEIGDFVAGDRLNVQVRACKAAKQRRHDDEDNGSTSTGTTTAPTGSTSTSTTGTTPGTSTNQLLLAKRVDGKPKKGSGSTTTGTTGSTTTPTTP